MPYGAAGSAHRRVRASGRSTRSRAPGATRCAPARPPLRWQRRRGSASASDARQRDEEATGRVIEQRRAHRALPPACRERGVLVVADDDEIDAEALRQTADLLDRLADGEVAGGVEAALAQRANTLVEHAL